MTAKIDDSKATFYPPMALLRRVEGDALLDTHAMATARDWFASGAWALLLLGSVGQGKSQAAAWLWKRLRAEALAKAQAPGCYERAGEVLWLRARDLQRLAWDDRSAFLTRCAGAYGLVVDELGGEDQRTTEAIGDLLERRADDENRRTVMTTNLDGKGFVARYGDRMASRIRAGGLNDHGLARWAVAVRGEDLRGTKLPPVEESIATEGEPMTQQAVEQLLASVDPEVASMVRGIMARRAAGGTTT